MSQRKTPQDHKPPHEESATQASPRREPLEYSKPPREWRQARQQDSPRPGERDRLIPETGGIELGSTGTELFPGASTSASSHVEKVPGASPEARRERTSLPSTYGVDRLVLLVRDPHWSYAWWELSDPCLAAARQDLGEKGTLVLRFYDISQIEWDGRNHHEFFDIEVQEIAGNWYVELGKPGASFVAEIGLRGMNGHFVALVRSNLVALPRESMSSQVDESWMILEEQYQRLFELSGGAEIGLGSAEILRALEERLRRELAAAGVSSFGISSLASRREP